MQIKTLILCTALTGALMAPALAKAEEHAAPAAAAVEAAKAAEPAKAEEAKAAEAAKEAPKAEKMEHKGNKMFEEADTNKDGKLSKEEFLARHEKKFTEIDANKDGSLTPDEMKAARGKYHDGKKGE